MINLDELERLHLSASPGPWDMGTGQNAELIEAMRNSIWEILTELKAGRAVVEALKKALEDACYVPNYVDDALDKYIEVANDKSR